MSEPTIVALSILGLVSLLMTLSLLRFGIDEAIRLWSVMGAVTGVAFGSITTYYFADKNRQAQVASYESKVSGLQTALADAKSKAALALHSGRITRHFAETRLYQVRCPKLGSHS